MTLVAINPNRPAALQLQDLSFSDVGESLDDMKARGAHRRISYPYLSDGEAQAVARSFGVVATPHIFVFDRDRTLQYEGRIDDSLREDAVKSPDARNAIDAVLAGKPAPRGAHPRQRLPGERPRRRRTQSWRRRRPTRATCR